MIIYNVTCNVPKLLADEWLQWLKNEHLPEVLATGKFAEHHLFRLLSQASDDEGINFIVQYHCADMDEYIDYQNNYAPALQQKTRDKFGDKVVAYRSLMEKV